MTPRLVFELVLLSAVWGGSFVFMRVLAPNIGALVTAELRLLLGGIGLGAWFLLAGIAPGWRRYWKRYLIVGFLNTAIPFAFFSYSALSLPGSYSAILNSLSPLWGAVFAAMWLGERLTARKLGGLALGIVGVALVARVGPVPLNTTTLLAIGACVAATLCYGLAGIYVKLHLQDAQPAAIAGGSQLLAGLVCAPVLLAGPANAQYSTAVIINIAAAGVVCGSFAYLLYYRLVNLAGPVNALSVTFLIPVFGMLWGALFLAETITAGMLAGCTLVLAGLTLLLRMPTP